MPLMYDGAMSGPADPKRVWLGLDVLAENIPLSLQYADRWVLWAAKVNGERVEKIPLRAYGGGNASSTDPNTWADFDGAIGAYRDDDTGAAGIGIVLNGDGLIGLDFDHCRNANTGEIEADVLAAVRELATYAEVSPSGTGVRAFLRGEFPGGKIKGARMELYARGRFLTVTGHRLPEAAADVRDISAEQLRACRDRFIPQRNEATQAPGEATDRADVAGLVAGIVSGENLHDGLVRLAAHYVSTGMRQDSVGATLRGIMAGCVVRQAEPGRWAERMKEIPRIVASAVEKFDPGIREQQQAEETQAEEDAADAIWQRAADLGQMLFTDPPEYEWLVNERIQAGRGILLTGIGGSSKSRFLYHLAIGLAIGRLPWDWQISQTGKSLLVMTEDTPGDVHRVMQGICASVNPRDRQRIIENVSVYALAGSSVKLLAKVGGQVIETPLAQALERRIQAIGGVRYVAIDPALGVTEGDEMDQSDQRELGRYADNLAVRTGAAVIIAAHSAKHTINADELSSHSSRGAGAITDAVRGEFAMRTMTAVEAKKAGISDVEERKRHVQLVATKGNHLPPAAYVPVWLRRGEGGVLEAADITMDEIDSEPTKDDLIALGILSQISAHGTVRLEEWRQACEEGGLISQGGEAGKKAMQRIVRRLLGADLIEKGFSRGVYVAKNEGTRKGQ